MEMEEDEVDSDDYDDFEDYDEDMDDDDFGDIYDDGEEEGRHWTSPAEFAGVDMITPRRSFKGAKNMETVKDCKLGYSGLGEADGRQFPGREVGQGLLGKR
jgi:nuclear receptor interaction protein